MKTAEQESATDAYRKLARRLLEADSKRPHRVIAVTSPGEGEGKTTVSVYLSEALSEAGAHVLLLDGDLNKPRHEKAQRLQGSYDLADLLEGSKGLEDVAVIPQGFHFETVSAGERSEHPEEVFDSRLFTPMMEELMSYYDLILLDLPNYQTDEVFRPLADSVDGVLVVITRNMSRREETDRLIKRLKRTGHRVIGFVMNAVSDDPKAVSGYNKAASFIQRISDSFDRKFKRNPGRKNALKKSKKRKQTAKETEKKFLQATEKDGRQ